MGRGMVARPLMPFVRRLQMHIDCSGEEQYSAALGSTAAPSGETAGPGVGRPQMEPLSGEGIALH